MLCASIPDTELRAGGVLKLGCKSPLLARRISASDLRALEKHEGELLPLSAR